MTNKGEEFEQLKEHMRKQEVRRTESLKVKTVNTYKWKQLILTSFQKFKIYPQYDQKLVTDLKKVVEKIPEGKFIEAIFNLHPLKPHFTASTYARKIQTMSKKALCHRKFQCSLAEAQNQQSTTCGSILKQSHFQQKQVEKKQKETYAHFTTMIEQETLRKELSHSQHPFSKIIEGLTLLLQNKYKLVLQKMQKANGYIVMEVFTKHLQLDFKMVEDLFKIASRPIVEMFCAESANDKHKFESDFDNFIVNFLRNHEKYCNSLRRIVKFATKKSIEILQFLHFSLDSTEIAKFDIPQEFRADYKYSTAAIMQFYDTLKGKKCLQKLSSLRKSFYKDIKECQQTKGGQKNDVNAQVQLQIFKFLLTKLKKSVVDIYAQLKYLELIYGEEQIGFQYQDASFMHSQLLIGFEAIRLKLD